MRFEYVTLTTVDSINVHYDNGDIVSVSYKYFTSDSQIITIEFGTPIFHAYKFDLTGDNEETKIIYGIFKKIFDFIVKKLSVSGRIMMTEKDYENYTEELFMGKPKEESK
jgi:allantoicase